MNTLIVLAASYLFIVPIGIFCGYFLYAPRSVRAQFFIFSVIALPLSYLLSLVAGALYYNPRPFVTEHITPLISHAADNGFPSDHALLVGTLAAILTVFNWRLGALVWVLAAVVGAARVLAHVHHTIDILGSFLIAAVATGLTYALIKRLTFKPSPEPSTRA